jgi:hypothetical protein
MIVEHSGRKRRIVVVTPLGSHQEQSHVVAFLLSVIKALKYSKPSNTQKVHLFLPFTSMGLGFRAGSSYL